VKIGQWIGLLALIISHILWQIQMLLLLFTAVVLATALNQLVQQLEWVHIKRALGCFPEYWRLTQLFFNCLFIDCATLLSNFNSS